MINTWMVATIVAVVAGVVGFFAVLRGSAFAAHAIPNGSFAGAAGAALLGLNTMIGLGVFSLSSALGIGWLGRRGRHDVATALTLDADARPRLALPQPRASSTRPRSTRCCSARCSGSAPAELIPTAVLAAVCRARDRRRCTARCCSCSVLPDVAEARGISRAQMELAFLLVIALATTMTVPVVGHAAHLQPDDRRAGGRAFVHRSARARRSASRWRIALVTVWASIAVSYKTNYPVGFFVGAISAGCYGAGRGWAAWRRRQRAAVGPGAARGVPAPAARDARG